jgi:hypothetical protein
MTSVNDPQNNLKAWDKEINMTLTWFFGKPHAFTEPIKFGGGSGKKGANLIENASE